MANDVATSLAVVVDSVNLTALYSGQANWQSVQHEVDHGFGDGVFDEQSLRQWFRQMVDQQYGEQFGKTFEQTAYPWWQCRDYDFSIQLTAVAATANDASSVSESLQFGDTTNVQVQGVDEADLIEADGQRLFMLRDSELLVFRANGVDDLALLSRVRLDEPATQMFLSGDRLAIVSQDRDASSSWYPYSHSASTTLTVLDVSDVSAPTLVQKTEVDGRLVDLRAIDGNIVMITSSGATSLQLPPLQSRLITSEFQPASSDFEPAIRLVMPLGDMWAPSYPAAQTSTHQYESREAYLERVEDAFISQYRIGYRSYDAAGAVIREDAFIDSVGEFRAWARRDAGDRLAVSVFDMHADSAGPIDTQVLRPGSEAQLYATQDCVYVFSQHHEQNGYKTSVVKLSFDSDTGQVKVAARGKIDGRLLNQFAADERDGVLRVVMTDVNGWRGGQAVYTLAERGARLKVLGRITGIAPNELLHSVTFDEHEVHFVTYRKVDPLFRVDLSDPENPEITGELKIPGYSEMLIEMDENHLLGIGRGANGGLFSEMQLSIFDVTDEEDPQRTHLYSLDGGRNTSTEATGGRWTNGDGDHHAVTFLTDEGLLALPVREESGGWWGWNDQDPGFENGIGGLLLFSIDVQAGIQEIASIEHDTMIRRSLVVGDRLYAISSSAVTAHALDDPSITVDAYAISDAAPGSLTTLTQYVSPDAYYAAVGLESAATPSRAAFAAPVRSPFRVAEQAGDDDLCLILAADQVERAAPQTRELEQLCGNEEDAPHDDGMPSADDLATELSHRVAE